MRAQGMDSHPDVREALEHLLAAGGKRIGPTLGLLIGAMLNGNMETLVTLGAAVELLHTATLVHDDLIDGSLLRRGTATLNSHWTSAATVLTGDFLFARAARLAAETDHLPLMRLFADTLVVIVGGELNQLFSIRGHIKRDIYFQRIYAKTASLFEMSCHAAALVCTTDKRLIESLRKFGYELGMAFQIADDILDFAGDELAVGKPIGSDLLQGLVTLPAICYAEANPQDPDVLALADGGWGDHQSMIRLAEKVRESDAIQQAMSEAENAVERATRHLSVFEPSPERDSLEELARFVVARRV